MSGIPESEDLGAPQCVSRCVSGSGRAVSWLVEVVASSTCALRCDYGRACEMGVDGVARVVWQEALRFSCPIVVTLPVSSSLVTLFTHVGSGWRGLLVAGSLIRLGIARQFCEVFWNGGRLGAFN